MNRREVEREVRAALKDPKRHERTITHNYPYTTVDLWMKDTGWCSRQVVKCAPEDEYNERIGYELALDRCIHAVVNRQIITAQEQKPKQPQRKQAIKVEGKSYDQYLDVWCDDDLAEAIRAMPFVVSCVFSTNPRLVCIDPRYNVAECRAAIEALVREL